MVIKKVLLYIPLILILFLLQSFFWVPTYDKQGTGNPARLVKYVQGSSGDAQILNPTLNADTSSSTICDLIFDGLIDLDKDLKYRPRLAESWTQYEEIYLAINTLWFLPGGGLEKDARNWSDRLVKALSENKQWSDNLRGIEVVAEETLEGEIEKIGYTLKQPARLKFTLNNIDQDFFDPVRKFLGEDYFKSFPYHQFIEAKESGQQKALEKQYGKILKVTEHNPVIVFELRKDAAFHDGHPFDSGDVLFTYNSIVNPKGTSPRKSDYEPVKLATVL
jgi:ABC-type transport system substrate-binding protein